ncbi:hypothetical protein [Exiguobacterium sp. S22-S28]|uniref:hypothetical protein n=1 Tax=Exiguobacterium sp. S22-S28 TaxID=3342768 RepID=UPI00372D1148
MIKRVSLVVLSMVLAVVTLLVAAQYAVGKSVVSFDQPKALGISVAIVVLLFLPPMFLSFFENGVVKVINAAYQSIIVLSFIGLIPMGFMTPNGSLLIVLTAVAGTLISMISTVMAVRTRNVISSRHT